MYNEIEKNVAKNIAELRKIKNLKQSELGERIGYSDKTISKWENGASVPDIAALAAIADFFDLSLDDIVSENASEKLLSDKRVRSKEEKINDYATLGLSVITVILIAVVVYVCVEISHGYKFWQSFVWAVPPSAFIVYRFSKNTTDKKWLNALSLSASGWGLIAAIYLQLLKYNLWQLFFIMIPVQAMIIISVFFKSKKKKQSRFWFF